MRGQPSPFGSARSRISRRRRAGGLLRKPSIRISDAPCPARRGGASALPSCLVALWVGLAGFATDAAQRPSPVSDASSTPRLLTRAEGRAILDVAWQQDSPAQGRQDCSHLVHDIYSTAGFEYPYASSYEIYAGNANFARVKYPRAGDLVAWPGHVGIVVDPVQHSFFSLVRSGLENQYYNSPYWRSRGTPRFYRFRVSRAGTLTASNTSRAPSESASGARTFVGPLPAQQATLVDHTSDRPPFAVSAKSATNKPTGPQSARPPFAGPQATNVSEAQDDESIPSSDAASDRPPAASARTRSFVYGPPAPSNFSAAEKVPGPLPAPSTAMISSAGATPTREEVARSVSDWSNSLGSAPRNEDLLKSVVPVIIVEQSSVEKIEIKRNHGWARVAVDSKLSIEAGVPQAKRRHEKIRWELRLTDTGWQAIPPAERLYIAHDVAVKTLAAQLARIAASDAAAQHEPSVLDQEAQLAGLLNLLLQKK